MSAALDPAGRLLGPQLGSVRAVLEANAARRKPKIAKGTRDFLPAQMTIRRHAFRHVLSTAFDNFVIPLIHIYRFVKSDLQCIV